MKSHIDLHWTEENPLHRAIRWIGGHVLHVVTMGSGPKEVLFEPGKDCHAGEYEAPGLSRSDLKKAFIIALPRLTPLPVSEARVFALIEKDIVQYVITRQTTETSQVPKAGFIRVGDALFETKGFSTFSAALCAVGIGLLTVLSGASSVYASQERSRLIEDTEVLAAEISEKTAQLRSLQSEDAAVLARTSYLAEGADQKRPESIANMLDILAEITPDTAYWTNISFERVSLQIQLNAEDAASAIASLTTAQTSLNITSGNRISRDRPGVETFSITVNFGDTE